MRVGVFVALLGGLYELLHKSWVGGDGLVAGDHADGVRIARHAVIRLGEAVELWTVHVGLYAFPCGVKSAEIGLLAGQRLERGRADGHLVERALAAVGLDHAADHRVGFVRAERGESLAVEVLRRLDRSVRCKRAPDGAWFLLYLQHLLDFCAFQRVCAHIGEVG